MCYLAVYGHARLPRGQLPPRATVQIPRQWGALRLPPPQARLPRDRPDPARNGARRTARGQDVPHTAPAWGQRRCLRGGPDRLQWLLRPGVAGDRPRAEPARPGVPNGRLPRPRREPRLLRLRSTDALRDGPRDLRPLW